MLVKDKVSSVIEQSNYISRDLSWLQFNYRVLDQAINPDRTIFERLKFLAITSSNLDEFFMIRVGSLYNYLDYGKERIDYSGLRETTFRKTLLATAQQFFKEQTDEFKIHLQPLFELSDFRIAKVEELNAEEKSEISAYFMRTIFPMLTPMVFDGYHTFPILMNRILIFGVVTRTADDSKDQRRLSFVQIPQNLPRFFEIYRDDQLIFVPIEEIIRREIHKLYRNIEILSVDLFRITRNGDFSLEESDDIDNDFIDEIKRKIKTRRTGRVVRIEVESGYSTWMMKVLKGRWELDDDNVFVTDRMIDFTGLWQIVNHKDFRDEIPPVPAPITPISLKDKADAPLFEVLKSRDILLHHPYNSIEPVVHLVEQAAEDPDVLAIKLTIYRLAKSSRITNALLKAAENGKHVSVLFEVKARFDEENNIREAQRLQKAGCFVIYGISRYKTHTKLLLIVRKDGDKITRYVHMSSGNYNEDTSRLYTDLGLLTTNESYAQDISEFFNVITGHSLPSNYQNIITAPRDMRQQLIELIRKEATNAAEGLSCGIVIKINSLEDREVIDELYAASQAGVPVKLIVRGICCLRPGRAGLSENIAVRSIVGDFLEHARLFYFHNDGDYKIYGGSADIMVRSFERRIESLFLFTAETIKQEVINVLAYNLKDNVNAYELQEDGLYIKCQANGEAPFNIHQEFFKVTPEIIKEAKLF
ncbi:polyphosphate kinase 1 [Rhodocytophaga aerolata]|uniref:Polyphosphate kinase n=1 Tax=Rhodocytophaga aerolata TaxID=455078 RepID=A0ABT8R5W2_9BACT|nr:polyphosphate kinase 1 [Rhodocytophaga aerolata]MDO1446769.1 polyphosphate kinase 1 [Rhodocytophaga aerolata]